MRLHDTDSDRTVELRPVGYDADDRVLVDAVVEDAGRRWELAEPCLRADEADELAGWLDSLASDDDDGDSGEGEGDADGAGWSSLGFSGGVLSLSGRRTADDRVELRIAILGMRTAATGTTDVVVGLELSADDARAAAGELALELAALPRG